VDSRNLTLALTFFLPLLYFRNFVDKALETLATSSRIGFDFQA
jgi:hypothetical protein